LGEGDTSDRGRRDFQATENRLRSPEKMSASDSANTNMNLRRREAHVQKVRRGRGKKKRNWLIRCLSFFPKGKSVKEFPIKGRPERPACRGKMIWRKVTEKNSLSVKPCRLNRGEIEKITSLALQISTTPRGGKKREDISTGKKGRGGLIPLVAKAWWARRRR